jgi:hypothetical protein
VAFYIKTNPYASLYRRFPHLCNFLGSIPSDQLQFAGNPSGTQNIDASSQIYLGYAYHCHILKAETASMLATTITKKAG